MSSSEPDKVKVDAATPGRTGHPSASKSTAKGNKSNQNNSSDQPSNSKQATTRSVDRALEILTRLILDSEKQTLSTLAKATGLSPSTALRMLNTLIAHDYVTQGSDGHYYVGARVKQAAAHTLRSDPLYEVSGPHLKQLALKTRETACLGILVGEDDVVYLNQVNSSEHLVQTVDWIGRTIPRENTALGEALSGHAGDQGYVISHRSDSDVTAVAVPVFDPYGIVGALSINAPSYRVTATDTKRFGELLVTHAKAVSAQLGAL